MAGTTQIQLSNCCPLSIMTLLFCSMLQAMPEDQDQMQCCLPFWENAYQEVDSQKASLWVTVNGMGHSGGNRFCWEGVAVGFSASPYCSEELAALPSNREGTVWSKVSQAKEEHQPCWCFDWYNHFPCFCCQFVLICLVLKCECSVFSSGLQLSKRRQLKTKKSSLEKVFKI